MSTRTCSAKARSSAKGIYEVDAFERALKERFPENRILSHDLLEGCYARAGLFSDVQLYEEYPSRYSADVSRRHRWIRGDWQLVRVAVAARSRPRRASSEESALRTVAMEALRQPSAQSRACGLDRPAAAGLDDLGAVWLWTLAVIGIILMPPSLPRFSICAEARRSVAEQHVAVALGSAGRHAVQAVLTLVFLPYESVLQSDCDRAHDLADADHPYPAARMEPFKRPGPRSPHRPRRPLSSDVDRPRLCWRRGGLSDAVGAGSVRRGDARSGSLVRLPGYRLVDQPAARSPARQALTDDQTLFLRKLARKTWAFFETFVGPDDHWLPPDNYQEHPVVDGRASHVADQHGTGAARQSVRVRLRLPVGRTTHRTHGECAPHDGQRWNGTRATSTTGTTRNR